MSRIRTRIWPDWKMRPGEPETEWHLRILLQELQSLASDAETLIRAWPPMLPAADETVADFDVHLELAKRAVDEGLITLEMWEKARAVDAKISEMGDLHDPSLWTDRGLRTRSEWTEVRNLAKEALAAMEYGLEPPPPWWRAGFHFRTIPSDSKGES